MSASFEVLAKKSLTVPWRSFPVLAVRQQVQNLQIAVYRQHHDHKRCLGDQDIILVMPASSNIVEVGRGALKQVKLHAHFTGEASPHLVGRSSNGNCGSRSREFHQQLSTPSIDHLLQLLYFY
jgi:hypothetical protein